MLTVALITGRKNARFDWWFQSLARQKGVKRITQVVVIDFFSQPCDSWTRADALKRQTEIAGIAGASGFAKMLTISPPRPNIWGGPHRIMRQNWWHASAARNTAFALCRNPFIALTDDRCAIADGWLPAVRRAMAGNYVMAGSYEKHHGLRVKNGIVLGSEKQTAVDNRLAISNGRAVKGGGEWLYGCTFALPIAWAEKVNGFSEDYCDGTSMEDIIFGMCLTNAGYPIRFDPAARIIEDRTPSECTETYRREDKGVSPNDKSHKLLEVFSSSKVSLNSYSLADMRRDVLSGKPFPLPTASHIDWYDGKPHTDWDK
jgi:hypothetical protein